MIEWIALIAVVLIVLYGIVIFNRLVGTRQMAHEAWSGIDVQLKRRSDLIPNLVETVKGYAAHERGLLAEVTELRNQARTLAGDDVKGREQAEGALRLRSASCSRSPRPIPTSRPARTFSNCSRN
jgi:LemA protein